MKSSKLALITLCVLSLFTSHASAFSTSNTTITRSFNEEEAVVNSAITVSVSFSNAEPYDLRGFYYADQIPQGLSVNTISVNIDGNTISNYLFESGAVGDVYSGYVACRWILETPNAFQENNPIPQDSTVEIVYTVSSAQEGTFHFDEFHWVGYYQNGSGAAFGHSEETAKETITFITDGATPAHSGGGGGGGCFVATAAYGSAMEPHVKVLREFRDRFLLANTAAKRFVNLYNKYSPSVAEYIARHSSLRMVARWSLLPLVGVSYTMLRLGQPDSMAIVVLPFGLLSAATLVFLWRRGRMGRW